jgi:hypothetical protein
VATQIPISIIIEAKDLATKDIKAVAKEITELSSSVNENTKSTGSMSFAVTKGMFVFEAFKKAIELAGKAVGFMISTAKELGNQFIELAERGGQIEGITQGFTNNFTNSAEAMDQLRKASNNTVDDFNLMLSANKAAMLGVTTDSAQLAKILEAARARGQQLGISTTQAFEDIVTGIGRMSPLILDNLGITTKAYQAQVAAAEEMGIVMTDAEKKQMLISTVLSSTTTPAIETASDSIAQYKTIWQNLKDDLAGPVGTVMKEISSVVVPRLTEVINLAKEAFWKWWQDNQSWIIPQLRELRDMFTIVMDRIVGLFKPTEDQASAFDDLATSITKDMIQGLKDIALSIGNIITWLMSEDGKKAVKNFIEDIKQISSQAAGTARDLKTFTDNLNKIYDALQKIYRVAMDLSTLGIWRLGPFAPGRQFGGLAGGTTLVGEAGPELVQLPEGSRVFSNPQSQMMTTNNSTANVNINVHVPLFAGSDMEKRRIGEEIWKAIVDLAAQRGKTPNEMLSFT